MSVSFYFQDPTIYRLKYFNICFQFLDMFLILVQLNLNLENLIDILTSFKFYLDFLHPIHL
jgi:hypothetical protein